MEMAIKVRVKDDALKTFCFFASLFLSVVVSSNSFADCYEYDSLGRIYRVKYDAPRSASPKSESVYELDAHGNRVTVDTVTGENVSCAVPNGVATSGDYEPLLSQDYSSMESVVFNQEPIADDDVYSLLTNSTQVVSPLEGDVDPEGGVLTLESVANGSPLVSVTKFGDQIVIESGSVEGSVRFSYFVSDPLGLVAEGSILVTVTSASVVPEILPETLPEILLCGDVPC